MSIPSSDRRGAVYDLLPAYFAGDASPDTRALVDQFFTSVRHPGLTIGAIFVVMAVITWLSSMTSRPEEWYSTFVGSRRD